MEGNGKLDASGDKKSADNSPTAVYRAIPEKDMEEEAVSRPKSLVKALIATPERDGADEKMLPKEESKVGPNSNVEMADVKISPNNEKQNGDAVLDIGDLKSAFVGLTKEELMRYANDPFWVRLRMFLFVTFWLLWAAMLVGAILIIYAAPKCDPPPPKLWWEKGPLAEVGNEASIEQLQTAAQNGIVGFILPWKEDTYIEFDDTHQLIKLVKEAKKRDIKVILDLDPSTSLNWFEKSEAKNVSVMDYYLWSPSKNGPGTNTPNNWKRVDGNESAWKYSSRRGEYYYAPLGFPLLNYKSPNVTELFAKRMRLFLSKGAAGVLLRNVPYLLVDSKLADENVNSASSAVPYNQVDYQFWTHSKTVNSPDLSKLLWPWRKLAKNLTANGPFMLREELGHMDSYKHSNSLVVDLPVKSRIFSKSTWNVSQIVFDLNHTLYVDKVTWPLWKINTTAVPQDIVEIVTYLLPGAPLVPLNSKVNEALLKIRESPSIMRGNCIYRAIGNNSVLAFIREISGNPGILVAVNPTNERIKVNLPGEIPELKGVNEVTIQLYSSNYNETLYMDINAKTDANDIPLSAKSALVVSYVPKKD